MANTCTPTNENVKQLEIATVVVDSDSDSDIQVTEAAEEPLQVEAQTIASFTSIDLESLPQLLQNRVAIERSKIEAHVHARGVTVCERMANRYNRHHNIEIFGIGVLVSVGIAREDRAKTYNKRRYCRIIAKLQPEHHQLHCKYGILRHLYPTKDLQRAASTLELDKPVIIFFTVLLNSITFTPGKFVPFGSTFGLVWL